MAAIANLPSFAKKAGVPQSVGKEFAKADKGKTFSRGGDMKEAKAMVKKEIGFMKAKGAPKSMMKHEMSEMKGMKKGGNVSTTKMGTVKTKPGNINGVAAKGLTKGKVVSMAGNRGMKRGGKA
jgi:hypothetical protein